jgi:hypothetical protein
MNINQANNLINNRINYGLPVHGNEENFQPRNHPQQQRQYQQANPRIFARTAVPVGETRGLGIDDVNQDGVVLAGHYFMRIEAAEEENRRVVEANRLQDLLDQEDDDDDEDDDDGEPAAPIPALAQAQEQDDEEDEDEPAPLVPAPEPLQQATRQAALRRSKRIAEKTAAIAAPRRSLRLSQKARVDYSL